MKLPGRTLVSSKLFVIEAGANGFKAYVLGAEDDCDLFAASSSMSTFIKVMETICNSNGQNHAHFVLEEKR